MPEPSIDHADQRLAAGRRGDLDPTRAGVDGILHQFLHNARRPLNDFTGGNLVDQGLGQLMDTHCAMLADSDTSATGRCALA